MSPTLDERATASDPQVTADHAFIVAMQVITRAVEYDGVPSPLDISLGSGVEMQFLSNATAKVDEWARLLGADATRGKTIHTSGGRPWRSYETGGALDGVYLRIWCAEDAAAASTLAEVTP